MNFLKNIYDKITNSMYYIELQLAVYIAFLLFIYIAYVYNETPPSGMGFAMIYIYIIFFFLCLIIFILLFIHYINKTFFHKHIPFSHNFKKLTKIVYSALFLLSFSASAFIICMFVYALFH